MCQKLRLLLGNLNDVVEKININNFRDNIVRYLEKKQYRIVDILEHYAVSNHHIVCQSFNDYHIGRPLPQRRQLIAILLLILLWTYTIKYTFLTLHHHDTLITAIGEPLHLVTERPAIIYSILLMAGLTVSIGRSHLFYFEKKHKYVILNLYYYLQRQLPFYKLNQTHNFTLSIKALLLLKFYVQPMIEGLSFSLAFFIMFSSFYAYFRGHLDYYFVPLFLNSLGLILWLKELIKFSFYLIFLYYVPIAYLNYKFKEMIMDIRVGIIWNNKHRLLLCLKRHVRLTKMVFSISNIVNLGIGLIYSMFPYMLVFARHQADDHNLLVRLISIIGVVVMFTNTYITNLLVASITVSNKSLPKYLYRVFCDKRYKDLKLKLKMYSLLHRIDYQFLGFYCFNMFEFTKIAFYQYMIAVVTSYILVNKIVDNFKWIKSSFDTQCNWCDLFCLLFSPEYPMYWGDCCLNRFS